MIVSWSEAEVRLKFCPFVREEFLNATPFKGQPCCIASACMAWRWSETHLPDASRELVKTGDKSGYCGLAGDPALGAIR